MLLICLIETNQPVRMAGWSSRGMASTQCAFDAMASETRLNNANGVPWVERYFSTWMLTVKGAGVCRGVITYAIATTEHKQPLDNKSKVRYLGAYLRLSGYKNITITYLCQSTCAAACLPFCFIGFVVCGEDVRLRYYFLLLFFLAPSFARSFRGPFRLGIVCSSAIPH